MVHVRLDKLERGFYRVVAHFGFMEEPQAVPLLEAVSKGAGIPFPVDDVTYYLGRENFLASAKGHMGVVTESIFAFPATELRGCGPLLRASAETGCRTWHAVGFIARRRGNYSRDSLVISRELARPVSLARSQTLTEK